MVRLSPVELKSPTLSRRLSRFFQSCDSSFIFWFGYRDLGYGICGSGSATGAPNCPWVLDSLAHCRDRGAHFVEAYVASVAASEKQPIASFDPDFDKFKDVRRVEPTF